MTKHLYLEMEKNMKSRLAQNKGRSHWIWCNWRQPSFVDDRFLYMHASISSEISLRKDYHAIKDVISYNQWKGKVGGCGTGKLFCLWSFQWFVSAIFFIDRTFDTSMTYTNLLFYVAFVSLTQWVSRGIFIVSQKLCKFVSRMCLNTGTFSPINWVDIYCKYSYWLLISISYLLWVGWRVYYVLCRCNVEYFFESERTNKTQFSAFYFTRFHFK